MIEWNDLPEVEKLAATYYDLYKDAHGTRPRWIYGVHEVTGEMGCVYSEEEMRDMLDRLYDEAQEIWDREAEEEKAHVEAFEETIEKFLKVGAKDREEAIFWYVQSLQLDKWDLMYGGERVCYAQGLPYKMATIFDAAVKKLADLQEETV